MDKEKQFYEELNDDLAQFYNDESVATSQLEATRYSAATLIGEGAIKAVYCVTDEYCNRKVAYAQIKDGVLSEKAIAEFLREVRLTSCLEHPNIARVYDVGIDSAAPYFTMELVDGQSLSSWLEANPQVSMFRRLSMFLELCGAVAYAHDNDILHLDLKPDNIQVNSRGKVVLTDWGIAYYTRTHAEGDTLRTQSEHGYIKGTPGFMAPEQADPDRPKSELTDVFGLGAILYYLMTMRAPFEGDSLQAILTRTRQGNFGDDSGIPFSILCVIRKSLESLPSQRYTSVHALEGDIEHFLNGFATGAERAGLWTQMKLFVSRNTALCVFIGGVIFILMVMSGYFVWTIQEGEYEANQAKMESYEAMKEAEDDKKLAADALESLKRERIVLAEAQGELAASFLNVAKTQLHRLKFKEALASVKTAVKSSPDHSDAQYTLGYIYFVMHRFADAQYYLSLTKHKDAARLLKVIRQVGKAKRKHVMAGKDIVKVMKGLGVQRPLLLSYLYINSSRVMAPEQFSIVAKHMIIVTNKLSVMNFEYNSQTKELNLSNNPELKTLEHKVHGSSKAISLLEGLPISKIHIGKTKLKAESLKFPWLKKAPEIVDAMAE